MLGGEESDQGIEVLRRVEGSPAGAAPIWGPVGNPAIEPRPELIERDARALPKNYVRRRVNFNRWLREQLRQKGTRG